MMRCWQRLSFAFCSSNSSSCRGSMINPVLAFINFWFVSLWLPEDDFMHKLKKVVVGLWGLLPVLPVLYIGYGIWRLQTFGHTVGVWGLVGLCVVFFIPAPSGVYLHTRYTKTVSDNKLLLVFASIQAGFVFIPFVMPDSATATTQAGFSILIVMTRCKYTGLLVASGVLTTLHQIYNTRRLTGSPFPNPLFHSLSKSPCITSVAA